MAAVTFHRQHKIPEETTCPICWGDYYQGEEWHGHRWTVESGETGIHAYHSECIRQLVGHNGFNATCPECRAPFQMSEEYDLENKPPEIVVLEPSEETPARLDSSRVKPLTNPPNTTKIVMAIALSALLWILLLFSLL